MQADKISSALFTISTIAIVAVILAFVWHDVNRDCYGNQGKINPITKNILDSILSNSYCIIKKTYGKINKSTF